MKELTWPTKTHELVTRFFDSTVWNEFDFRDDDIVIGTYAKSGTTWMQQIVGQLIFNGASDVEIHALSPWLDLRITDQAKAFADLEAQRNRRFIKTHLPLDALVYSPRAKYIYVARDGRDAVWSFYNHHANMTPEALGKLNDGTDRLGPQVDQPAASMWQYFLEWLERDGYPIWPFWTHIRGWCGAAHLPNLLVVHYADLKASLPIQIRRISAFLGIAIDEARFQTILYHCSFDYMKENADRVVPNAGKAWKGGARTFINKGTNGRWRDTLTPTDIGRYETEARRELGERLSAWLAGGSLQNAGASRLEHA